MATLRIQFPEKETPTVLSIAGDRITIGRRADNTVQIVDRMISAFHAELILEGDHYRLHDLGSTNGTSVDGNSVTDFHLREKCKIGFGPVDCEFDPAAATKGAATEKLPTRIEVDASRRENEELRSRMAVLDQQIVDFKVITDATPDEAGAGVLKEELARVIRERAELQDTLHKREREFTALKTELARMNRDRQNLQDALSQAHAMLATYKEKPVQAQAGKGITKAPSETTAPADVSEAMQTLVGVPKPAGITSKPAAPSAPSAPARAGVAASAPSAPSAPGLKPLARPAAAGETADAPARGIAPLKPASRPVAGPSGTQRISLSGTAESGAKPHSLPKLSATPLPRLVATPKVTPGAVEKPAE